MYKIWKGHKSKLKMIPAISRHEVLHKFFLKNPCMHATRPGADWTTIGPHNLFFNKQATVLGTSRAKTPKKFCIPWGLFHVFHGRTLRPYCSGTASRLFGESCGHTKQIITFYSVSSSQDNKVKHTTQIFRHHIEHPVSYSSFSAAEDTLLFCL
jgi:hypothetical protein